MGLTDGESPGRLAWRGRRSQFTHCIDLAPTILEAIGLPEPKSVASDDEQYLHEQAAMAQLGWGGWRGGGCPQTIG